MGQGMRQGLLEPNSLQRPAQWGSSVSFQRVMRLPRQRSLPCRCDRTAISFPRRGRRGCHWLGRDRAWRKGAWLLPLRTVVQPGGRYDLLVRLPSHVARIRSEGRHRLVAARHRAVARAEHKTTFAGDQHKLVLVIDLKSGSQSGPGAEVRQPECPGRSSLLDRSYRAGSHRPEDTCYSSPGAWIAGSPKARCRPGPAKRTPTCGEQPQHRDGNSSDGTDQNRAHAAPVRYGACPGMPADRHRVRYATPAAARSRRATSPPAARA